LAAARDLLALGPQRVIVKLGARGALAVDASASLEVPVEPLLRVIDPVGAGDAFLAGYLAGQLRGFDLPESVALANRCGAHAMTIWADQEGLPVWSEVAESYTGDVRR